MAHQLFFFNRGDRESVISSQRRILMRLLIALLELFKQLSAWDTANRLATKFPRLQDLRVNPSPEFDMPT